MPFDLKVVFTGLSLVCLQGDEPCKDQSKVYLVNALHEQTVCRWKMEGHHRPLLAFDVRHLLPGSTDDYTLEPAPDGGQHVVASLVGKELCVRVAPRRGRVQPLPDASSPPVKLGGRSPSQDHPQWWKPDVQAYDWIAYLGSVEEGAKDKPYCPQVNDDLAANPYVASRVQLHGGTVKTQGCKYLYLGFLKRMFAMDYVVWETSKGPSPEGEDFPKALPDQVVWQVERLPNDHIVVLQDCAKSPVETLFRLDTRGKDLELHVSNLPERDVRSAHGPHLDHFRWYYRLLDWDGDGSCASDECPPGAALPTLAAGSRFGDDTMWGLLSTGVHCPPGGSGSP